MTTAPNKTYLWVEDSYYNETMLEVVGFVGSHYECDKTMNEEVMSNKVQYDLDYKGTEYADTMSCPKKWLPLYNKILLEKCEKNIREAKQGISKIINKNKKIKIVRKKK